MFSKWRSTAEPYKKYWAKYGGLAALVRSPYFQLSIIIAASSYGVWSEPKWFDYPTGIIPNLLGFSLGALAIFLGFGSEKFRDLISGDYDGRGNVSPFIDAVTTFVHFIFVQCLCLVVTLILVSCNKTPTPDILAKIPFFTKANDVFRMGLWFVGYLLFIYALVLTFSAAMSMYRFAILFDRWRTGQRIIEKKIEQRSWREANKDRWARRIDRFKRNR